MAGLECYFVDCENWSMTGCKIEPEYIVITASGCCGNLKERDSDS